MTELREPIIIERMRPFSDETRITFANNLAALLKETEIVKMPRRRFSVSFLAGCNFRRVFRQMDMQNGALVFGDLAESRAVREVFGDKAPAISSTKSLSGHSLGAAGVQEAIYCLLMMEGNFIAGSANIDELDPEVADLPIVRQTRENVTLNTVMSNSFGFGGTNATLVLKRWQGQ